MPDEGGDPVCWLERVCPECGAFAEAEAEECWRCGERVAGFEARRGAGSSEGCA